MIDHPAELMRNRNSPSDDKKKKLFEEAMKPVQVISLYELKMVLGSLLSNSANETVTLQANVKSYDENKKKDIVEKVEIKSESVNLYSLIVDGMVIVKNRIEALEKMKAAIKSANESGEEIPNIMQIWDIDKIRFNVDNLIERRLGGKRCGLKIRWKLTEGVFEFDPYTQKLYEVEVEDDSKATVNTDKSGVGA